MEFVQRKKKYKVKLVSIFKLIKFGGNHRAFEVARNQK